MTAHDCQWTIGPAMLDQARLVIDRAMANAEIPETPELHGFSLWALQEAKRLRALDGSGSPPATGRYCVVVVATLDRDVPYSRELSRDRYIAKSVGEALDLHAPDPAPGTKFEIEYQGRAKWAST